ncbi:DUF4861 family protein [Glaciecola sp. MH2013]|uniref:DUF4861 family protein n=1 Tax=Glaciecola sp. MH2013 TaxID=2785524 RepID=UPI00189E45F7|nr:DUF4861 family protein [Glaciecola sp. MH2013]MBF7073666.1 DUF4861 family protein [Glaciecola sp. MH2013]
MLKRPSPILKNRALSLILLSATLGLTACGADSKHTNNESNGVANKELQHDFSISQSSTLQSLTISNPLNMARKDELVFIDYTKLPAGIRIDKDFVVLDDTTVLKHEWVERPNSNDKSLVVQVDLHANESKNLAFITLNNGAKASSSSPKAYAELAVRVGASLGDDERFKGGQYVQMQSFTLPNDHTIGNKLFKYEGFGWESELAAYRYYFDNRGAIDVFAKQKAQLALKKVGLDGGDYHALAPWGMDVLKVGASLGLGAVAANTDDGIVKVSQFDASRAKVFNGAVFSGVLLEADAWQVGNDTYDLNATYRIAGGQRLTEVIAKAGSLDKWATGIVDHSVDTIDSENTIGKWCYRASFGKQSLNDDNLGLALFYECRQSKLDNDLNIAVSINASEAHYYFLAAWEAENKMFSDMQGFVKYLNEVQNNLNNPILVK